MNTSINDVIDNILAKKINRHEALSSFDGLSETEQSQLLSKLSIGIPLAQDSAEQQNDDEEANPGEVTGSAVQQPLLEPVHERQMSDRNKAFIARLFIEYETFAPKSRAYAAESQSYFVDQRKTAGLKKFLKGIQFHITYDYGEGAYLVDVDGNRYIDVTGDNGVNLFGQQPAFIKDAIKDRLDKGYPLVGYTEELFEAARLFCEITENERVLFTQSGTEAVMWAVRLARAVTRKKKIVIFDGAYHGLSDTVLAYRDPYGGPNITGGPGTLQEFADELIILDWDNMDELAKIEKHADEIAAVLVEPVQSRAPGIQPVALLKALRQLTLEHNITLIFDEMITGFRVCARGAQGLFNIKADMTTYGKVPGGGMPTGMIAGDAKYMDYIDGGSWDFDDDSMPNMKRTMMAGTHTRNPIKIAATLATLKEIKKRCNGATDCATCNCFQKQIGNRTSRLVNTLSDFFSDVRVPIELNCFSSLFRFKFLADPNGVSKELFFIVMRMSGIETSPSGNFFLNSEHTDEHVDQIIKIIKKVVNTLIEEGFYFEPVVVEAPEYMPQASAEHLDANDSDTDNQVAAKAIDSAQADILKNLIIADLQNFQQGRN